MAADSVGQIGLDLVVNKSEFEKQMSGIQGLAKKVGKSLAAAFAVKKLVDFGKSCIELGSDLSEVQNVVDVTFPHMSKQIDQFAKNASTQFGLSETMSKRFTGTFGAMAKAFGFNEKAAYDMSTTLTGLSGDVASFYNISQDEAYTKLKSVFTGETESLKDLGIVMTQTALDSYALANGFGKTSANMSEMEKVALRYKFVQDQLTSAAGDFSRTSDGWANQVRILQLQFDSLKATIGQGLINVLSPVIKVINTIIGKLMSLANAFKAFTEFITGNKGSGGGASTVAADMGAVADSAGDAASGMNKAAGAAKKAKQAFGLAKFDELNVVSSNDSSGGGSGSGGSGGGGYESDQFDMGTLPEDGDAVSSKLKDIVALVDQLKNSFSKGFWDSFGDTTVFDSIQTSIQSIKDSLNDIFTDSGVQAAATEFANTFMYSLGQVAGAVASIGTTIADNLLGGISLYLDQNKARIKEYLIQMFNIGSEISTLIGNFSSAIADIFSVFRSDSAKQITADIIGIFSSSFQGVTELGGKFARDIIQLITKPITDNSDQIKERIQGLLDELAPVFDKIKKLVDGLWDGLNTAYDTVAKPVFDAFTEALSGVVDWLTKSQENFDIAVGSVVAFFAAWEVVKLGEFITNAGGVVAILSGLVTGFVSNTASIVAHTAALLADKLETAAIVALYAKDFVVNLATGTAALVKQAAQFAINTAAKIADTAAQVAMTAATVAWNAVCAIATTVTTALGAAIAFLTSPIGLVVVAITALIAAGVLLYKNWDEVKAYAATIWGAIKDTVSKLIEAVQEKISAVMQAIRTGIETALNAVKEKWDTIWGGLKDTTVKIFEGIWNGIKGVINKILGGVESMANGVIKGINKLTSALSNIKFDVPDWVPGIGGNSFGIDIPSISEVSLPRLAQGGFVKANTPRLAMIGDNRNYGEIVAPEDKMMEWLNKAVELGARMMGGGGGLSEDDVYYAFKRALNEADLTATLDTDRLFKAMKAKAAEYRRRTGKPAFE
jgi:phage-related protein